MWIFESLTETLRVAQAAERVLKRDEGAGATAKAKAAAAATAAKAIPTNLKPKTLTP